MKRSCLENKKKLAHIFNPFNTGQLDLFRVYEIVASFVEPWAITIPGFLGFLHPKETPKIDLGSKFIPELEIWPGSKVDFFCEVPS